MLVLEENDVWEIVVGTENPLVEVAATDVTRLYTERVHRAAVIIMVAIDDSAHDVIHGMTDPKAIWTELRDTFVPNTNLRRLQAFRALATATLLLDEDMQDYVNRAP